MLYDLLKHYSEIEKKLEVFRIEVASRLGKEVYIEEDLQMKYGSLSIWYGVELDPYDLVFELRVELRQGKVYVDLDDLRFIDSCEYDIIKKYSKMFE